MQRLRHCQSYARVSRDLVPLPTLRALHLHGAAGRMIGLHLGTAFVCCCCAHLSHLHHRSHVQLRAAFRLKVQT